MKVGYLLWDFGDTLVDERWVWPCPDGIDDWTGAYRDACSGEVGRRWNCGAASVEDVAAEIAKRVPITNEHAVAHMKACCHRITFFEGAWSAARAAPLPQAIVTVNPDVFIDWIVPNYALDTVFSVIVTSAQVQSDDKANICDEAMRQLGCQDRAETLLLDNVTRNVDAWRALGGNAYLFRTDEQFVRDFEAGGWDALAST